MDVSHGHRYAEEGSGALASTDWRSNGSAVLSGATRTATGAEVAGFSAVAAYVVTPAAAAGGEASIPVCALWAEYVRRRRELQQLERSLVAAQTADVHATKAAEAKKEEQQHQRLLDRMAMLRESITGDGD